MGERERKTRWSEKDCGNKSDSDGMGKEWGTNVDLHSGKVVREYGMEGTEDEIA